jgi:hypothetical protein
LSLLKWLLNSPLNKLNNIFVFNPKRKWGGMIGKEAAQAANRRQESVWAVGPSTAFRARLPTQPLRVSDAAIAANA